MTWYQILGGLAAYLFIVYVISKAIGFGMNGWDDNEARIQARIDREKQKTGPYAARHHLADRRRRVEPIEFPERRIAVIA